VTQPWWIVYGFLCWKFTTTIFRHMAIKYIGKPFMLISYTCHRLHLVVWIKLVYWFCLGDAATVDLNLVYDQIRSELKAHQLGVRFNRDRPSEWHSRISRREESWDEIRNMLLDSVVCNQSILYNNVSSMIGKDIKCLDIVGMYILWECRIH